MIPFVQIFCIYGDSQIIDMHFYIHISSQLASQLQRETETLENAYTLELFLELFNLINSYQLKAEFRGRKRLLDFPLYVSLSPIWMFCNTRIMYVYIVNFYLRNYIIYFPLYSFINFDTCLDSCNHTVLYNNIFLLTVHIFYKP